MFFLIKLILLHVTRPVKIKQDNRIEERTCRSTFKWNEERFKKKNYLIVRETDLWFKNKTASSLDRKHRHSITNSQSDRIDFREESRFSNSKFKHLRYAPVATQNGKELRLDNIPFVRYSRISSSYKKYASNFYVYKSNNSYYLR